MDDVFDWDFDMGTWSETVRHLRLTMWALLAAMTVAAAALAFIMIATIYRWDWTRIPINYLLSFTVEVNGVPYTGATVVEVIYQAAPSWQSWMFIEGGPIEIYSGEAATLSLPDGKLLCLLVSGHPGFTTKRTYSAPLLAHTLLGPRDQLRKDGRRQPIVVSNASRVNGSAEIPPALLPTILIFEDPKSPHTAHIFDPERAERWLGPGGKFVGAKIEVTSEPASHDIYRVLPWLKDVTEPRLTSKEDPFSIETQGRLLYLADFF